MFFRLGCPEILNRSSWNARPYASRDNLTVFPVTHIVVRSIEDSITIMDHQDCIQNMKQTQAYHMAVLGWFDIGYNFVICNTQDDEQEIYKGRGWRYIGAHCKGYNARSLGEQKVLFSIFEQSIMFYFFQKQEL